MLTRILTIVLVATVTMAYGVSESDINYCIAKKYLDSTSNNTSTTEPHANHYGSKWMSQSDMEEILKNIPEPEKSSLKEKCENYFSQQVGNE